MKKRIIYLISLLVLVIITVGFFVFFKQSKNGEVEKNIPGEINQVRPIGMLYSDASPYLSAIRLAKNVIATSSVSGLIVPHHLLAKDLMADTFAYASKGNYKLIVLLSPDHYSAGKTKVSVTERSFSTVFGEISSDSELAKKLKESPYVSEENFFYREHGLQAELPFIKYYFPDAKLLAITFKPGISQLELDRLVSVLGRELPLDSLIIQSTDFSHYLSSAQAVEKDTETIKVLKQNDCEKILSLNQPENIDSLAAAYVQASLQRNVFQSSISILNHKNSQDYTAEKISSSTSYVSAAYIQSIKNEKFVEPAESIKSNNAELIFVGDIMLSRYIGELMSKKEDYSFPYKEIKPFLSEADSVFGNLESPISDKGKSTGSLYPFRADPLVVLGLKNAGFTVMSVANNHAFDYGREAFTDTLKNIKNAGISYAGGGVNFMEAHNGAYQEINGVKIIYLAYTDLLAKSDAANDTAAGVSYLDISQMVKDIKVVKEKADLVIVSFHWGREYETTHNAHQEEIARAAIEAGASLIIGHHPHVAQDLDLYKNVYIAYSLGNFIFDQNFSPETSSGLALKVTIKNKKVSNVATETILFNHNFQPYIKK
ncbi:MAG: AmmeMemoRadiSam system protein B [Candidatus Falkowbacteria bacterium]